MTEYLTAPKLALKAGISDNTVRRYVKNYSQFFVKKEIEGYDRYPEEQSITLIRRINEISQAGKRRAEVVSELEKEFEMVPQAETKIPVDFEKLFGGNIGNIEVLNNLNNNLNRIATALEALAEKGHAI